MSSYAYQQILNQVAQQLTPDEQLQLLEDVAALIRDHSNAPGQLHSLRELRGLGKELWRSIDVDKYLEEERNSWDG